MMRQAIMLVAITATGCGLQLQHAPDGQPGSDGSSTITSDGSPDAPPPCADGMRDGDETDVDCGGPTCHKCSGGKHCESGSDCASGNCDSGSSTCAGLGVVSFAAPVSYDSAFKPYVMMSTDLDGDGDLDLAAANEEANSIVLFINDGNGTFVRDSGSQQYGFPTGEYPTGGAIVDLNHDGIPDVVTANFHGNSVSALLGVGAGNAFTLAPDTSYATKTGAETSNLAVGDLDGDGFPDVVATNPMTSSISVFLGHGDGTLKTATDVALSDPPYTPQPYSVAISDYNGDGINDLAVADNSLLVVHVLLGKGDGTFTVGQQPKIDGSASFIIIAHDMDLDGKVDLVVANRSSNDVSVLLGRGDGTFRDAIVSSVSPSMGPYSLAVADFNLDGVPDLVTANFMTFNATVLLGNGDGSFRAPIDTGMVGMCPYGITAGDFNGDGKPDFATANAVSDDVTVMLSTAH